jgi:hypothetical protein
MNQLTDIESNNIFIHVGILIFDVALIVVIVYEFNKLFN